MLVEPAGGAATELLLVEAVLQVKGRQVEVGGAGSREEEDGGAEKGIQETWSLPGIRNNGSESLNKTSSNPVVNGSLGCCSPVPEPDQSEPVRI